MPAERRYVVYPLDRCRQRWSGSWPKPVAWRWVWGLRVVPTEILHAMNKQFLAEEVREISDLFAASGIRRTGFLLLGGPGETQDTVAHSLAFAESLHLDQLRITVGVRIYPHTPLATAAVREGVITPEDDLLAPRFYLTPGLTLPAARAA